MWLNELGDCDGVSDRDWFGVLFTANGLQARIALRKWCGRHDEQK